MILPINSLICGIDPSLESTGICIMNSQGKPIHYECIVPYPLKELDRLQYNYESYVRLFSTYRNISVVAFECQVPQMRYAGNAGHILGLAENIGIMKLAIAKVALILNPELLVLGIPPGDNKRYATDNYRADKEMMMAAVKKSHMKQIQKEIPEYSINDVADAYHIANMAIHLCESDEYTKYIYQSYMKETLEND